MTSLSNMRIGTRLAATFGALIAVFLLVSGVVLVTSAKQAEMERWNKHTYQVLGAGEKMLVSMINMETGARGYLVAGKDGFLEPWRQGLQAFDAAWNEAKKLTSDNPRQQERLEKMKERQKEFQSVAEALFKYRAEVSEGSAPMESFVSRFAQGSDKAAMDGFRQLQAEFDGAERELLVQRSADAQASRQQVQVSIVGGAVLSACMALALGFLVTRSVTRPIGEAVVVAEAVAAGDLTSQVVVRSEDETGQLMRALGLMNENLAKVVGQVRSGTDTIATASGQIASGNQDLSQRTEEQASSLEETAASMEELTGTVKQNAENAHQANQLSQSASQVAIKGGEVVGRVVETMSGINAASRKIADIITVIDGIAFQTNILALNAAVEAARAGEQGRGFAVVASEVRSLAQRSASAAKEIKALIDDSVAKVDAGSELVGQAGETMQEIVGSIKRVTDIMGEIAAASQEQTRGIEQVNQAITQMDQVTQQNAALVEEASAAAQSMREQAGSLVEAVSVFKVDGAAPVQRAEPTASLNRAAPARVAAARPAARKLAAPQPKAIDALLQRAAAPAAAGKDEWAEF